MKRKYEKPLAKNLNSLSEAQGQCNNGSIARPQGFGVCGNGAVADGGLCFSGSAVAGCTSGAVVTNWCGTGGSVG